MSKRWMLVRRSRHSSIQASSSQSSSPPNCSDSIQRVVATYSDPVEA